MHFICLRLLVTGPSSSLANSTTFFRFLLINNLPLTTTFLITNFPLSFHYIPTKNTFLTSQPPTRTQTTLTTYFIMSLFVRGAFKAANRTALASASRPVTGITSFRTFTKTAIRKDEPAKEDSIHVVSYEKGQRTEHDIEVDDSKPVIPAVQDVEIKATPLKARVYDTLTPTLKKFCLPGKVAVITG